MKKSKGAIQIRSPMEQGTTVEVLFPEIQEEKAVPSTREHMAPSGKERILMVDVEKSLVKLVTQNLKRLGYTVTGMTDSVRALALFRETPHEFDLVITDMAMPQMSGDRLAAALLEIRDDLPILLCTGHSDLIDEDGAKQLGIKGFLKKPLDRDHLARAVRDLLDKSELKV